MRCCVVLFKGSKEVSVLGKLGELTSGNWVNPRATDPMQPDEYRNPSPASQPDYINDRRAPNKTHDIATIAYYPRAGRQYVEPQTMIMRLNSKGEATVEVVKTVGTQDVQFSPVTTAADSEKMLKVDVFEEVKKALEDRWWLKSDAPTPRLGEKQYQWTEVDSSEWDRKD